MSTEVIHRLASRPGDKSTTKRHSVDKSAYRAPRRPLGCQSPFVHSFPSSNPLGRRISTRTWAEMRFPLGILDSSASMPPFGLINSGIHRSSAQPVDNPSEGVEACGQPNPKSRSPQGNRVNAKPVTCSVPGSETLFIDTLGNSPIAVRKPLMGRMYKSTNAAASGQGPGRRTSRQGAEPGDARVSQERSE